MTATFGGETYGLNCDFRDILEIFSYLQEASLPEFVRWAVALRLFYDRPVPEAHRGEAAEFFCSFINGGRVASHHPGPRLLDWEQDGPLIISDVNKVAGTEIRALPFVHWWTFLSWFGSIGEGRLSTVVTLRDKLRRGEKPEEWERRFYRENRELVDLKPRYSPGELAQRRELEGILGKE